MPTKAQERADTDLNTIQTTRAEEVTILDYETVRLEKEQKRSELEYLDASAAAISDETALRQVQTARLKACKQLIVLQHTTDK